MYEDNQKQITMKNNLSEVVSGDSVSLTDSRIASAAKKSAGQQDSCRASEGKARMRDGLFGVFQPVNKYSKWYTYSTDDVAVSVCGHAYYDQTNYCGRELARLVAESVCFDWDLQIGDFLKRLNGNWALIVLLGDVVYAAVDRNRSFPILYNESNGLLYLNDDIISFRRDGVHWCSEAIEEFLWSGYPADKLTLYNGVYQIPAGTYLRYNLVPRDKSLIQYFNFSPVCDSLDSDDQLSERLATLLDESVRRAGELVRGNIILPLSGGMDSRVIAAALKRNGFENVVCFSYGRKGNSESATSRSIAEALNYQWHFIEYSPKTWAECMFSDEMKEYLAFACNGCSMPVYSNWYSIKTLRDRGILSPGDAFMPGHTGDFLTGGHIPQELFSEKRLKPEEIISLIIKKHFSLWSDSPPRGISSRLSTNALAGTVGTTFSNMEAAYLCEKWNWRERQAKMIINSNRIYEYFGFPWLVPFWDAELTDFYLAVPFRLRCNRRLYVKSSVEHIFSGRLSVLADITLAGCRRLNPRKLSILSSQTPKQGGFLHMMKAQVRRKLIRTFGLVHFNHALCLRDCFAAGRSNLRVTVHQMLQTQGLEDVLNEPEFESVLRFVDKPVGQMNAYATLSLFILAQLYRWNKRAN